MRAYPEMNALIVELLRSKDDRGILGYIVQYAAERIEELEREVEGLSDIINGAFAHSYGPYSDKELLRRVVVILKTARHGAAETAKPAEKPKGWSGP